jgi:hypothetical protein
MDNIFKKTLFQNLNFNLKKTTLDFLNEEFELF